MEPPEIAAIVHLLSGEGKTIAGTQMPRVTGA